MNKFDLEKALAGEPVVLRSGEKAYIRHVEKAFETAYPLIGYVINNDVGHDKSWTIKGRAFTDDDRERLTDIVGMWKEPLLFEYWDLLSEDIKYLAKHSNERWFGYEREPNQSIYGGWSALGDFVGAGFLNKSLFPECDWKESLIKRPEND